METITEAGILYPNPTKESLLILLESILKMAISALEPMHFGVAVLTYSAFTVNTFFE